MHPQVSPKRTFPKALFIALAMLPACLSVPPAFERDAEMEEPDAGPPPPEPPKVVAWTVVDHRDRPWPASAAPRWPRIHVAISEEAFEEGLEQVHLLEGPLDAALRDDLDRNTLLVRTQRRLVPARAWVEGRRFVFEPLEPLTPGDELVVAVQPSLRSPWTGLRLGEVWTEGIRISDSSEAGAAPAGSWPADGAGAVAPALSAVALRFDGRVELPDGGGVEVLEEGRAFPSTTRLTSCPDVGWDEGYCVEVRLLRPLGRSRSYTVRAEVRDAAGAPVGPWEVRFESAPLADRDAPGFIPAICAVDEVEVEAGCLFTDDGRVSILASFDEAVRLRLEIAGQVTRRIAPRGQGRLSIVGLPPARVFEARLEAQDTAGHTTRLSLEVETLEPLATLSITEVRANARGPSPRQEYVEVLNYGSRTLSLEGFSLADHPERLGDVIVVPARLAPGQRGLLVPNDFDPEDPADPIVPPGVPLIRVATTLGSGGLANRGEPVFLRDPEGRRVSAAPALPAPGPGWCIVRVTEDPRGGEVGDFAPEGGGGCTPGS